MESVPEFPDPTQPPFYYPCLAKIPSDGEDVQVMSLLGSSDLGLPMSIVWTAAVDNYRGTDREKSQTIETLDSAILGVPPKNSILTGS
jgi:hypothetical protein